MPRFNRLLASALFCSALVFLAACQGEAPKETPKPAPPAAKTEPPAAPQPAPPPHKSAIGLSAPASGIDPALFLRVMDKRKSSFRACYGKALLRNPALQGQLSLRLSIAPSGRVGTVEVAQESAFDAELAACVKRVVRRVEFPALPAGQYARVEFPLRFSP